MLAVARSIDIQAIAIIIPACESPCWADIANPLLLEIRLSKGLTTNEILKWGKRQKFPGNFTRNILAWLSFNSLISFDDAKQIWTSL